jgi:biotin transport system substrate-specific component
MMESTQTRSTARTLVLCGLSVALIAVGAFIKIPLFGVPFSLQTLFVVLSAMLLGPGRSAAAAAAYMLIGLAGIPIFTGGGGPAYVLQPTFGYILGFVAGAALTGALVRRRPAPSVFYLFLAGMAGIGVIYLLGVAYYAVISGLYLGDQLELRTLLVNCFLITLPGDFVKCLAAALLAKRLRPALAA